MLLMKVPAKQSVHTDCNIFKKMVRAFSVSGVVSYCVGGTFSDCHGL